MGQRTRQLQGSRRAGGHLPFSCACSPGCLPRSSHTVGTQRVEEAASPGIGRLRGAGCLPPGSAPCWAGGAGQALGWAGPGGSSSPGKGQPGLARSLDPAVREARGSAGSGTRRPPASSPPRWWAGRQPRRGRGSPWPRLSRPAVGAGLAPRCQPLPGLKWPAWRLERGPVSERPGALGSRARPAGRMELRRAPELFRKLPARSARRTGSLPRPPLSRRAKEKPLMALHLQSACCAHWLV